MANYYDVSADYLLGITDNSTPPFKAPETFHTVSMAPPTATKKEASDIGNLESDFTQQRLSKAILSALKVSNMESILDDLKRRIDEVKNAEIENDPDIKAKIKDLENEISTGTAEANIKLPSGKSIPVIFPYSALGDIGTLADIFANALADSGITLIDFAAIDKNGDAE